MIAILFILAMIASCACGYYFHKAIVESKNGIAHVGMDMNKFAIKISEKEGLKKQVNIAQIKEILRIVRMELYDYGIDLYDTVKKGKIS